MVPAPGTIIVIAWTLESTIGIHVRMVGCENSHHSFVPKMRAMMGERPVPTAQNNIARKIAGFLKTRWNAKTLIALKSKPTCPQRQPLCQRWVHQWSSQSWRNTCWALQEKLRNLDIEWGPHLCNWWYPASRTAASRQSTPSCSSGSSHQWRRSRCSSHTSSRSAVSLELDSIQIWFPLTHRRAVVVWSVPWVAVILKVSLVSTLP